MKPFKLIILILFFSLSLDLFAQEKEEIKKENPFEKSFWEVTDYYVGFTPLLYINTSSSNDGPVSPIYYPINFGFIWPNDYFFSIQPSVKFFTSYFYMKNGQVIPAEVENRTAMAFNFLLNVPAVFKIDFWEKTDITLSAGLAFLIRFATLAQDVGENDFGDTGSASGDLSEINKYFWSGFRLFYLSFGFDWMFKISEDFKIGPEFYIYLPIGSIFSSFSFNGMMITFGVKVIL